MPCSCLHWRPFADGDGHGSGCHHPDVARSSGRSDGGALTRAGAGIEAWLVSKAGTCPGVEAIEGQRPGTIAVAMSVYDVDDAAPQLVVKPERLGQRVLFGGKR